MQNKDILRHLDSQIIPSTKRKMKPEGRSGIQEVTVRK